MTKWFPWLVLTALPFSGCQDPGLESLAVTNTQSLPISTTTTPPIGACAATAAPANAITIFAGASLPQNWGAYPFSGAGPNLADASIPCSPGHKVISYVEPSGQYVGFDIAFNGGSTGFLPVAEARHVSFDIYVSVANTIIATSAPYQGEPNDHPWLINTQGILGNPAEAISYPQGWSHMEFDVPAKPSGDDNVSAIVFEKWSAGVVTVAIDNLYIYK